MIQFCKRFPDVNDVCQENVIALLGEKKSDGNFLVCDYYNLENKSKDKMNSYYVGRDQYIKASNYAKQMGLDFIGIVHTHLSYHDENPSSKDYATARGGIINGVLHNNILTLYNKRNIIKKIKIKVSVVDNIIFKMLKVLKI